jgi:hypothetical protein
LAVHFSQPSLYLLIPEFSLLLQPSLNTVTQQKQQHTLRFFFKKRCEVSVPYSLPCTGLQQSQNIHKHIYTSTAETRDVLLQIQ